MTVIATARQEIGTSKCMEHMCKAKATAAHRRMDIQTDSDQMTRQAPYTP